MTQQPIKQPNFEETVVEGLRAVYKQIALQNQLLDRIAIASERTADSVQQMAQMNIEAPNYQRSLETFAQFDWTSIGATIERSDHYGVAIVNWRGMQFVRRSPSNKYQEIIFYSRCIGKDDDGNNKYERLISFKPVSKIDVEPVPVKVERIYNGSNEF